MHDISHKHFGSNKINRLDATYGAGTVYPSGAPELTLIMYIYNYS